MAVKEVLTFPHPLLKQKIAGAPSTGPLVEQALADLADTMTAHPGCVGIAAPQIGLPLRVLVVDVSRSKRPSENHGLLRMVEPVILEASQWKMSREGCLSFPNLLANVKRAQKIVVEFGDGSGGKDRITALGFDAVAIQHEIDHPEGILFLDKIRSSKDLFERPAPANQPL